jgi:hypothetical protein
MASYINDSPYSYGEGAESYPYDYASPTKNTGIRRRTAETASLVSAIAGPSSGAIKRLDFMFPKVDSEFTVKRIKVALRHSEHS